MTDKHIWKNGETITADLLNGMSDYADEKVDAIPKIDPTTLVKTTALASDVNLLAYTSAEVQTKTVTRKGWLNFMSDSSRAISLHKGVEYSYSVLLKNVPVDACAMAQVFGTDGSKQVFGNTIPAGTTGYSVVTFTPSDVITYLSLFHEYSAHTDGTEYSISWAEEKLNVGPYATPYCDQAVTDVGGQKPVNGHINMDAYALLADVVVKNGGLPVTAQRLGSKYDLDTILDAGIYYVQVAKNQPIPGNGTLLVIGNNLKDSDRRATQLYFADTLTGSYTYHRNVGYTHQTDAEAMKEWSPWVVDATSADINALNNRINDLKTAITKLQGGTTA